eukprot:403350154
MQFISVSEICAVGDTKTISGANVNAFMCIKDGNITWQRQLPYTHEYDRILIHKSFQHMVVYNNKHSTKDLTFSQVGIKGINAMITYTNPSLNQNDYSAQYFLNSKYNDELYRLLIPYDSSQTFSLVKYVYQSVSSKYEPNWSTKFSKTNSFNQKFIPFNGGFHFDSSKIMIAGMMGPQFQIIEFPKYTSTMASIVQNSFTYSGYTKESLILSSMDASIDKSLGDAICFSEQETIMILLRDQAVDTKFERYAINFTNSYGTQLQKPQCHDIEYKRGGNISVLGSDYQLQQAILIFLKLTANPVFAEMTKYNLLSQSSSIQNLKMMVNRIDNNNFAFYMFGSTQNIIDCMYKAPSSSRVSLIHEQAFEQNTTCYSVMNPYN